MAQLSSSNITTNEVGKAIGLGSSNVSILCSSAKVNMWSKWKPISLNAVTLTDTLLTDYKCGLSINETNLSTLAGALIDWDGTLASQYQWDYLKPLGGSSSPYRLGDFRNYEHYVLPMLRLPNSESEDSYCWLYVNQFYPALNLVRDFDLARTQPEGVTGILPADLKMNTGSLLSTYYLGVLVFDVNRWNTTSSATSSIVMVKTASSSLATEKIVSPDYLLYPSGDNYLMAFFLSPRNLGQIDFAGDNGTVPTQSDYVWLDSSFYSLSLYNEQAQQVMWLYDRYDSNYDTLSEASANSSYYITGNSNFWPSASSSGMTFSTGKYFTLSPDSSQINFSNSYAVKLEMKITAQSGGDAGWRNLVTYASSFDEYTGLPSAWNMIYIKNSGGYFCIGHGDPNSPEPEYTTTGFTYSSVTKLVVRNYYYPSGDINTMYVHVDIHTTDQNNPAYTYSFSVSGERMWTPAFFRFGTYGTYEAPTYITFNTITVNYTPNTAL